MKTKILVLGGDGMAGSMIATYLTEREYDVTSTTRRKAGGNKRFLDVLHDISQVDSITAELKPDFVVNCIGSLNKNAEQHKPDAIIINTYLPHYLNQLSSERGFKLIHISTDCVFSGEKGGYIESDMPDAGTFYGRSKALGEVVSGGSVTFRTSIIGPDPNVHGIGLFNWFMSQQGEINGFRKVIWSGVTTLELAKAIEKSFSLDISGLYHLVNNESINKFDLINLFKRYMGKTIEILPDESYESDKSLVNNRDDFQFSLPTYTDMVQEMATWIFSHREMYPELIESSK